MRPAYRSRFLYCLIFFSFFLCFDVEALANGVHLSNSQELADELLRIILRRTLSYIAE